MTWPRAIVLEPEAAASINQILGIVIDAAMSGWSPEGDPLAGWEFDLSAVVELEARLGEVFTPEQLRAGGGESHSLELHIEDVALVLHGMAYTEVMSADYPWIEMVRWTSDFVAGELRPLWNEHEWATFTAAI